MLSKLPNVLTLFRIAMCPVLVILLSQPNYLMALLVFLVAGLTDGLDGYIAKRYNCISKLGTVLDPLADKLLIASTYIMLTILEDIPFYLLIVVMFRDLVIVVGYMILVMMDEKVPNKPTYTSKLNTFMQIVLMLAVLLEKAEWLQLPLLVDSLVIGVICTTVISGTQYVWSWGIRRPLLSRAD